LVLHYSYLEHGIRACNLKKFNICFAPSPPQENSSKDVFNLLILDENRVEVENHLRFVNGFINIQLEPVEPASQVGDENE